MRVIVNADDFGLSQETAAATVESFAAGHLTSATIMARMPATEAACAFARSHPEYSFGVHLTLTGSGVERPVSDPADVAGLVDGDGRFPPTRVVRARALAGRLPARELELELAAQLALVRDAGVTVSHVDSHQHLHKFAAVRSALERVLPRFGVTRVRGVQDVYLRRPLASPTYWLGRRWGASIASRFTTTDHFYMPATAADERWTDLLDRVAGSPAGATLEVGVHPGPSDWRLVELEALREFVAAARARGHRFVTWAEVPASS